MKKLLIIAAIAVLAMPVLAQSNPAQTVPFDHWAYDAVQELVDQGIIIGYPDGTFKGDRAMTRYEFAAAIARMLDVLDNQAGGVGPKGETGAQGPAGAAGQVGVAGAKGDTGPAGAPGKDAVIDEAAIAAIVNKLMDEFKDELADVRKDLDYLTDDVYDLGDRVTYLEEAMKGPKAFGWLDYRIGLSGDLDAEYYFDNLTAVVGIEGQITDDVSGCIALKVRDTWDGWTEISMPAPYASPRSSIVPMVDGRVDEEIWLDEAYITFSRGAFPAGTHTVGRQYFSMGPGLLIDNQRSSIQGWRWQATDLFGSPFDFDIVGGGADPRFGGNSWAWEFVDIDEYAWAYPSTGDRMTSSSRDAYVAMGLSYDSSIGEFGFNWLANGVEDEIGMSGYYTGSIFGRAVAVEHAWLTRLRSGLEGIAGLDSSDPCGWMASAEILKGNGWALSGFYSDCDAYFNPYYSIANPYYEAYGDGIPWERWLRNPLTMANLEVLGGELDINIGGSPFTFCYYDIDANSNDWSCNPLFGWSGASSTAPYDTLYAVSHTREIANGVNLTLTYARQEGSSSSYEDLELASAGIMIGF